MWKTRERMRTTLRVILILNQASSAARLHKTLAQKLHVTWWQELQKRLTLHVTWWQEFKERFVMAATCWQELQKEFAMATTWWQQFKKSFPTAPLQFPQEVKRRRAPQVSHNFAVRTPLRQLKQTKFCRPFSNWRRTVILPMSITTVTVTRSCLNPSWQQCPPSTGNQRNLDCLKI